MERFTALLIWLVIAGAGPGVPPTPPRAPVTFEQLCNIYVIFNPLELTGSSAHLSDSVSVAFLKPRNYICSTIFFSNDKEQHNNK